MAGVAETKLAEPTTTPEASTESMEETNAEDETDFRSRIDKGVKKPVCRIDLLSRCHSG